MVLPVIQETIDDLQQFVFTTFIVTTKAKHRQKPEQQQSGQDSRKNNYQIGF